MANTVPFSLVLSSPLQCPCGSYCGQFQSSSNKSTSGRRWVLMQHLCQEKFVVRISSSCYLEGAGCQCLLFTQPWACVGLFLYFPSACPTRLRVPHSHSTPQGGESHSSPSSWAAQHHLDQHQDIPGHHRASANNGKVIFTGYACRSHTSILLLKETTTITASVVSHLSRALLSVIVSPWYSCMGVSTMLCFALVYFCQLSQ